MSGISSPRSASPSGPTRLVERGGPGGGLAEHARLLDVDPDGLGDRLDRGRLAALRLELALRHVELAQPVADVDRQPHDARLVGQRAGDRLLDPQRRVGGELEALAPIELLGGADQADRALLDQVHEGEAEAAVALGDRDDEAQVRLDHVLLGVVVAALDALGELDFLRRGQQRSGRDAVQEEVEAVFFFASHACLKRGAHG